MNSQTFIYTRHRLRNNHLSRQSTIRISARWITHPVGHHKNIRRMNNSSGQLNRARTSSGGISSISGSTINADQQHNLNMIQEPSQACQNDQVRPHFLYLLKSLILLIRNSKNTVCRHCHNARGTSGPPNHTQLEMAHHKDIPKTPSNPQIRIIQFRTSPDLFVILCHLWILAGTSSTPTATTPSDLHADLWNLN